MNRVIILFLLTGSHYVMLGQVATQLSLQEAINIALKNNGAVKTSVYELEGSKAQKKLSSDIGKTSVLGTFGQYNSYAKADNNITITQSIPFPTVFSSTASLGNALVRQSELKIHRVENDLAFQVKSAYHHLVYLKALRQWIIRQDSINQSFLHAADVRYRTGEGKLIEKTTAETQTRQIKATRMQNEADIRIGQTRLQTLLNAEELIDASGELIALDFARSDTSSLSGNSWLSYYQQQVVVAEKQKYVTRNHLLPDFTVGYFNQTLIGTSLQANSAELATRSNRFQGFQAGISIPLWIRPQLAKIQVAEAQRRASASEYDLQKRNLQGSFNEAIQEYQKNRELLDYYLSASLPNADLLLSQSQRAYQRGEISYLEYLQSISTGTEIRTSYLITLNNYNQSIIMLEYLTGTSTIH